MLKQALLAASLMMVAGASQAEMIHADFNYGDRMVTVDTETGLAWMKFDLTRYYHLNSAEAATEAGGEFEGWSLADAGQVYELWENFFGEGTYTNHASYVDFTDTTYGVEMDEYNAFKEFMGGGAWGSSGYHYGSGYFWQDREASLMGRAGFIATSTGVGHYYAPEVSQGYSSDHYTGIYMVMDASSVTIDGELAFKVPLGGAAVASLGLLGMAGMRKRKGK
tara:strand:+ start:4095 stop:4760 length:666 start_codon:yes stop_codon:yes gene_type:complete